MEPTTQTPAAAPEAPQARKAPLETYTLSDGRVCTILPGKGRHAVEATRICNGDQSLWMPSLMAQLVKIDGNVMVQEDFLDLDLRDYMALTAELSGNFT